jgi:hypothetical protein
MSGDLKDLIIRFGGMAKVWIVEIEESGTRLTPVQKREVMSFTIPLTIHVGREHSCLHV